MLFILSIHPVLQLAAIILAFYAAYLGLQRVRSLHFGHQTSFQRHRHVVLGSISLIALLGGLGGGLIIAELFLGEQHGGHGLHETIAFTLLPFLLVGISSGLFLYLRPANRKFLPAVHGLNNLIILALLLMQIFTGWHMYLDHVLKH